MRLPKFLLLSRNSVGDMEVVRERHTSLRQQDVEFVRSCSTNIVYYLPTRTVYKHLQDFDWCPAGWFHPRAKDKMPNDVSLSIESGGGDGQ